MLQLHCLGLELGEDLLAECLDFLMDDFLSLLLLQQVSLLVGGLRSRPEAVVVLHYWKCLEHWKRLWSHHREDWLTVSIALVGIT